jgi:hypothetical protein
MAFEAHKNKAAEAAADIASRNSAAISGVTDTINGLTAEYNRLWDSIKDEAPEEVMGIVETQTRARMSAIEAQREDAVENLKTLTDSLGMGFDEVIAKLDEFISRLGGIKPIVIPVELDLPDGGFTETTGRDPGEGFASGTPMLDFSRFGPKTYTALHGDEAVIPRGRVGEFAAQVAAALGGGNGGDMQVHVTVDVDGNVLDKRIQRVSRRAASTGLLRPQAAAGRSF